jgi:predicted dithiol-disulfide oxidoreductase (DUF899 family)
MLRENARIIALQTRLSAVRAELQQALAEESQGEVKDYTFSTPKGPVKLSALFGKKRDLFMIHNMGAGCSSCTMWADGFNGLYPHISDRASFVVSSPDAPEVQQEFAAARGWVFPMVSSKDTRFAADMGFENAAGRPMPGVSAFQRRNGQTHEGKIVRVSAASFNEGDDYCTVWRLFDMLPEGVDSWRPKKSYG